MSDITQIFPNGVIIEERGWPGHFIAADRCVFRRNTLVTCSDIRRVVVSTVGNYRNAAGEAKEIGYNRYYETYTFSAVKVGIYWEADVHHQLYDFTDCHSLQLPGNFDDNLANTTHDTVVASVVDWLANISDDDFKVRLEGGAQDEEW